MFSIAEHIPTPYLAPIVLSLAPFQPPPARHIEFVQFLTRSDVTLHEIADAFDTTLEALSLYLTSEEGLALVATTELACALRVRLAAMHHLPRAIDALGVMLEDYTQATRNIPARESSMSLEAQAVRETQRQNARRAGHLLFRLAHFTPRPIRSYIHNLHEPRPTPHPTQHPASHPTPQLSARTSPTPTPTPTPRPAPTSTPQHANPPRPQPIIPTSPSTTITNPTATPRRRDRAAPELRNTS